MVEAAAAAALPAAGEAAATSVSLPESLPAIPAQRMAAKPRSLPLGVQLGVAGAVCAALAFIGMRQWPQPAAANVAIENAPAPPTAPPAAEVASHEPQQLNPQQFLAIAKPLAERFLAATKVDDLLPLVRGRAQVEAKIRAYYPDGAIAASGLAQFDVEGAIHSSGHIHRVKVRTRKFEDLSMAFVETPDGLKIDWESWVGWPSVPWTEYVAKRPLQEAEMRVTLTTTDYYNYRFSDDKRWQAYRIESPDGESILYGYLPRGSELERQLTDAGSARPYRCLLGMHFIESDGKALQVMIDRLITPEWVIPSESSQSESR